MLLKRLVRWIVAVLCVASLAGCAKKSTPPAPEQEQTKTAAEYKAEADKQINEQNAAQELQKLEQSVAQDDANQPQ
jgi:hypothetical protein